MTALRITNDDGGVSTIDASDSESRIFEVDGGGATTLDHLDLTNGSAPPISPAPKIAGLATDGASGGAILDYGNLTLTNDQFESNSAFGCGLGGSAEDGSGGALFDASASPLTIKNCTFDCNVAQGGGLGLDGPDNGDDEGGDSQPGNGLGGAVSAAVGTGPITITACTFSNNEAIGGMAATMASAAATSAALRELPQTVAALKIADSTFADNSAVSGNAGEGSTAYGSAHLRQQPE